ncbi:hypothetical protein [Clostridium beijerinckii]|uniref:Uncharacterized protein n=1 Tax=Clostridium beijerinckii TaxID=1520 RepID=A0A9Q5CYA1_CLOBE|nr:hypothetical protein [Clostridium beijerinckii]AQS04782.1 hypothetical protein CLBIJ_22120 [Clostridium beijerinckii]MBA2887541.1 hypothetical protein [Clostridium beijerinckii]MBA2902431.1 hypothetical protein [Clostridium beijerinckii]MBA2912279.1 hypothetical protein [Clostridium beijerinckii]MBA9015659.1 hypothetical protein [Clostridium beijerinckii]
MSKNISSSFIAAKEITIAALANKTVAPSKEYGVATANFFEAIYDKLKKIEDDEATE